MDDSPVSVHIWMSLYDWMRIRGCGWQVTANPIIDSLQKTISELVNTCKGMVVVCVNCDVAFHGGRGDLGTSANKVGEICKAAGALVTENDRLWRVAHALTGKNYKIPGSSNLQHFLLKRLWVEKSIDVIAPSHAFVNDLEEICISEPDLRFNVPKNMEESKVKFEYKPTFTAQSRRKQERQNEGYGGQDAFGNIDANDQRLRWYTVSKLNEFICELCKKEMQRNKSKVLGSSSAFNPSSCVNCCANWNADTNGVVRSTEGRKLYTRLFRGVQGRDPGPPTSHGERQQCSGHDHDYTGTGIFQIEEGAIPRGFREHDGGSGGAVLWSRTREAIVRSQRCGHMQEFRRG